MAQKTVLQFLLNEPQPVEIGPAVLPGEKKGTQPHVIRFDIKAPTCEKEDEYFLAIGGCLDKLIALHGTVQGGKAGEAKLIADTLKSLLRSLAAKIISDGTGVPITEQWVTKNTNTAAQVGIIKAFCEQIGWGVLKETFFQARDAMTALSQPRNGSAEAPSWLRPSSPTSTEPSPS